MPAIRFAPVRIEPLPRKKYTQLTLEDREKGIERRRQIMSQWYCFFFGDDHLKNPIWSD